MTQWKDSISEVIRNSLEGDARAQVSETVVTVAIKWSAAASVACDVGAVTVPAVELGASEVLSVGRGWLAPALDAVGAAGSGGGAAGPAGGALAMTVQRDQRDARAPRTRFMITDILDAPPRDLSAHRDSDSDRSATDSPG